MHTVLPISVAVADRWLAAASRRLTGDIPELVACISEAVTRLLRVAFCPLPQGPQHVLIYIRTFPLRTSFEEPNIIDDRRYGVDD
jgi:hypothetical protein